MRDSVHLEPFAQFLPQLRRLRSRWLRLLDERISISRSLLRFSFWVSLTLTALNYQRSVHRIYWRQIICKQLPESHIVLERCQLRCGAALLILLLVEEGHLGGQLGGSGDRATLLVSRLIVHVHRLSLGDF